MTDPDLCRTRNAAERLFDLMALPTKKRKIVPGDGDEVGYEDDVIAEEYVPPIPPPYPDGSRGVEVGYVGFFGEFVPFDEY